LRPWSQSSRWRRGFGESLASDEAAREAMLHAAAAMALVTPRLVESKR